MSTGCLLCVFGLPASGKSTLVNQVEDAINSGGGDNVARVFVVSFDRLVPLSQQAMIVNEPGLWKATRRRVLEAVDHLVGLLQNKTASNAISEDEEVKRIVQEVCHQKLPPPSDDSLAANFVVVIDDNLYYSSMRYEWYKLARKNSLAIVGVYLKSSVDSCLSRNNNRPFNQLVDENVITRMANLFEEANVEEFDGNLITLNAEKKESDRICNGIKGEAIEKIIKLVSEAIERPLQEKVYDTDQEPLRLQDRLTALTNVTHQLDCLMRSVISDEITVTTNCDDKRELGRRFSKAKQKFLRDFRDNPSAAQLPPWLERQLGSPTKSHKFDIQAKDYAKSVLLALCRAEYVVL